MYIIKSNVRNINFRKKHLSFIPPQIFISGVQELRTIFKYFEKLKINVFLFCIF